MDIDLTNKWGNVTPIIITFDSKSTIKQIYQIHIKEIKQTSMILQTHEELLTAQNELEQLLATVKNRLSRNYFNRSK